MKRLLLLLTLCVSGISLLAQPPLEYGARFTGKYTIALTAKYDGEFSFGVNGNLRSFNGPFAGSAAGFPISRPIDYNLDIKVGASTFSGNMDLSLSFGAHQVYGDQTKNFGIGGGLYAQWAFEEFEDGGQKSEIKLNASLAPGLHWSKTSLGLAFTTNLVGVYNVQGADQDEHAAIEILSGNGIGVRGDLIFGNANPTFGLAFNSYYHFEEEEPEEPEEEGFPIRSNLGLNYSF